MFVHVPFLINIIIMKEGQFLIGAEQGGGYL